MAHLQVPLAEAIRSLRAELTEALETGTGQAVQFRLGPVELELQVQVATEAGGEAGAKFWLVSVGGNASRTASETHTLKLTLHPTGTQGGDLLVVNNDGSEIE